MVKIVEWPKRTSKRPIGDRQVMMTASKYVFHRVVGNGHQKTRYYRHVTKKRLKSSIQL